MSDLHYFRADWIEKTDERLVVDVCVYGGSSAGVIAGVEAVRQGKSVVVLQPGKFIGGLTTGGLGWTDYGQKRVIGGLSRQFYRDVGKHYGVEDEFHFEPHVAAAVYDRWIREHNVPVRLCQYLERVEMEGRRIKAITLMGGLRVEAKVFIDATYEGDLLAKAGVSYTVGRESNDTYGETLNGIQVRDKHQFSHPVDPYVVEGDPSSGLLPQIEAEDLSKKQGQGDHRVQAYCFRMCMTDDPSLKIDWPKPDGYDPRQYELARRWFAGEKDKYNELLDPNAPADAAPRKFDVFPHRTPGGYRKTDTNNHGPISSDFIGANWSWPEACYELREKIFQAHVTYQRGFYWFMANGEVPDRYRNAFRTWGLARDEFTTSENWPHTLYVREGRRMIGDYVITEHDCRGQRKPEDPVAMGSYAMDSHNCTRFVKIENGKARVLNDGDVQVGGLPPYPISYRCIVPKRGECENLLVPVCLSSSHIAYGSARMEPVFMALGQTAAMAASAAIDAGCIVQDVNYPKLRAKLLDAGQVIE